MREMVKIFKSLSDTNRLRILKMLEIRPMAVCEISAVLGLAMSTVSKHLYLLREAGFLEDRKEGKWVIYALPERPGPHQRELLALLTRWLELEEAVQKDRQRAGNVDRFQLCGVPHSAEGKEDAPAGTESLC